MPKPVRPTLQEIYDRGIGDLYSRTSATALLSRSVEKILVKVLAGLVHGVHGHLDWLADQLLPDRADEDGVLRWGAALDLPRKAATSATRGVQFTATASSSISAGQSLQDADGNTWTVTSDTTTVGAGTQTVTAVSDDTGTTYNLDPGATLSLVTPVANVETDGTVTAHVSDVDAIDLEGIEPYRERVLIRLRAPIAGGGPGDYVQWALEQSGVARAWEFGNRVQIGTVSVAFTVDDADPIPDSGEVAVVQAALDALMPLDMQAVYVVAPVPNPVDMTIAITPNSSEVQAAVTAELQDLFATEGELEEAEPAESKIREAISTANGESAHDLTSIGSLEPGTWGLNTLGTVTFTTLS